MRLWLAFMFLKIGLELLLSFLAVEQKFLPGSES